MNGIGVTNLIYRERQEGCHQVRKEAKDDKEEKTIPSADDGSAMDRPRRGVVAWQHLLSVRIHGTLTGGVVMTPPVSLSRYLSVFQGYHNCM